MLFLSMPAGFPHQTEKSEGMFKFFNTAAVRKVDSLGAFLLLAASMLFVSAVEEGGTEYPWTSAVVLSLISVSAVLWILFFYWQKLASGRRDTHEPVLPWRLLTDRFIMGFLL